MSDQFWERAARIDPMWAILSDPSKVGRRWRAAEFFATGRREVSLLFYQLSQMGCMPERGHALDFGCGIGRLSQALGTFFDHVTGIDVSKTMIEIATGFNRYPGRVEYAVNQRTDLSLLQSNSIDFVYSDIVLQHLPPERSGVYLVEFVRILRSGGIVVFQLPSEPRRADERVPTPLPMSDAA